MNSQSKIQDQTSMKKYPYTKYYEHDDYVNRTIVYHEKPNKIKQSKYKYNKTKNYSHKSQYQISKYLVQDQLFKMKKNKNKTKRKEKVGNRIQQEILQELNHYKQLCAKLRKHNNSLKSKIQQNQKISQQQLIKLQEKVDRLNQNYEKRKNQNQDKQNQSVNKIYTRLDKIEKNILVNPKNYQNIRKSVKSKPNHYKKFYEFFQNSLEILEPNKNLKQKLKNDNFSNFNNMRNIWNEALQFLITHQFTISCQKLR